MEYVTQGLQLLTADSWSPTADGSRLTADG